MIEAAVSATAGGACAGSAALLYYMEKLPGINKVTNKLHTDRIQAGLIATASAGIVATPAGAWWNSTVNDINDWVTGAVGSWTGLIVTGVPALFATVIFVNDLVTRKVEHRTRIVAAVLPVLVTTVPGPIGTGIQTAVGWMVTTVGKLVAAAFGIGG